MPKGGDCCDNVRFCGAGHSCCNSGCIKAGDKCCPNGHGCGHGSECCENGCMAHGLVCCKDGSQCAQGQDCCNGGCMPVGAVCCGAEYCPVGDTCCHDECFPGDAECCAGSSIGDGIACFPGEHCCPQGCCWDQAAHAVGGSLNFSAKAAAAVPLPRPWGAVSPKHMAPAVHALAARSLPVAAVAATAGAPRHGHGQASAAGVRLLSQHALSVAGLGSVLLFALMTAYWRCGNRGHAAMLREPLAQDGAE